MASLVAQTVKRLPAMRETQDINVDIYISSGPSPKPGEQEALMSMGRKI